METLSGSFTSCRGCWIPISSDGVGFGPSGIEIATESCTGLFETRRFSSTGSSLRSSVCIDEGPLESLLEEIS